MKKNGISVIVPVYNVQDYLEQCLDSLCQQTNPFDEVILVNDGSTDGSQKICERYCERHNNFILVNQSNQGLSCARNRGVEIAQADYILFVDSDDYVSPDMGAVLRKELEKGELEILYYSADVKHEIEKASTNNPYIRMEELCKETMTGLNFFRKSFPQQYIVSACMAVYDKRFLLKNNLLFPKGIYYEDEVFSIYAMMSAERVACIPNKLYIRRYRNNSIMTSNISVKKCKDIIEVQNRIWEFLHNQCRDTLELPTLRMFISNGIYQVIDKIGDLKDKSQIKDDVDQLVIVFFEYWSDLYRIEEMSRVDCGAFLFILKSARTEMDAIENDYIVKKFKEYENLYYATEKKYLEEIIRKLSELPLNCDNKKIGIYGIGNHTVKLIDLYQRYVGNLESKIYFIVSDKCGTEKFMDREVVDCSSIPQETDEIIISSKVYQNEMRKCLLESGVKENIIHTIYAADEISDLVIEWKILNMQKE